MPKFLFFPPKTSERHERSISGKFTGANGSISNASGRAWTATRTGEGVYSIVLDTPIKELLAVHLTPSGVATTDIAAKVVSFTLSTKTLVVETAASGTPADVIGDLYFTVHYKAVDVP